VLEIFQSRIPFNLTIGLDIDLDKHSGIKVGFAMQPHLIGNFTRGILHGGVVCAALDVVGGLAVFADVIERLPETREVDLIDHFSRLSTIDLRIDFLRPGAGENFVATASVLRTGSKIAVVRMDLHNDEAQHIAAGTASYRVG